jgi:hypothetical protein
MSWLPDWVTGFDRQNYEAGVAAEKKSQQLNEELYAQGAIGSVAHEQARKHYEADFAYDPGQEIDKAFNDELSARTGAVRGAVGGGINAIFKSVFGSIPWQVWLGVALYIAWRVGLFNGIFGKLK